MSNRVAQSYGRDWVGYVVICVTLLALEVLVGWAAYS